MIQAGSWVARPYSPKATVLHAVKLPDRGGDTQYVNMHRAYEDLPEATKQRIDGLRAVHVYQSKYSARKLITLSDENRKVIPDARLWVNPDCGLKTRNWTEVCEALSNMVQAAQALRSELDRQAEAA